MFSLYFKIDLLRGSASSTRCIDTHTHTHLPHHSSPFTLSFLPFVMQPFAAYNHPQRSHPALPPLLTFIPPLPDACMYRNDIDKILLDGPRFCQCFVPLLS